MQKDVLRREFFKLRAKGFSYATCRRIIRVQHGHETTVRTLKRWVCRLEGGGWDLCDKSRRPHNIHRKITPTIVREVLRLRKQTGWGQEKLFPHLKYLNISEMSIKRIISEQGLCRKTKTKGKRVKWVRWQREHPNSLWQMDHTDEQDVLHCYTLAILDDATRYVLALVPLKTVTTDVVTHVLDELIKKHGTPTQILTDNGGAYGGKSKNSRFDRWCKRRGIQHIRTKVHSPTTNGKVERLFKTLDEELPYCKNDFERFRLRYNHFRPHSSLNGQPPAQKYHSFAALF